MRAFAVLGFNDKAFYKKMLAISVPIMLQQLISTAMYMVDTMMIGGLGDIQLAGVGAANQIAFLLDVCMFGVMSGGSVFMAQYWGKGDHAGIRRTLGLCFMLGGGVAALFLLAALFAGGPFVSLFSNDPAVIASGLDYLSIAAWGYLFKAVIYPYGTVHKSCGKPLLPMITGALAILVNMALNYCLIYGNLGFPALGVKGAAIATIIGSAIDAVVLAALSNRKGSVARSPLRELLSQNKQAFLQFIGVSLPVFIDDAVWALGTSASNLVFGRMGTDAFAAMMIVNTVDKLTFVMLIGIGTSCGVMLGNTLGEGAGDKAVVYAKRYLWMSGLAAVVLGLATVTLGSLIPDLYNVSESVRSLSSDTIVVLGAALPIYALNFTTIVGVLRSGGNTRAAAILDLLPLWLIALPVAAVTGLLLGWSLPLVYLASNVPSGVVRLVLSMRRTSSRNWVRNVM